MEYTIKNVAEHRGPEDAWIVIHGHVYNVSEYQNDHPGGADVLAEASGTDASEAFDNAGHSEDAFDIMKAYNLGKLKGFQNPIQKPTFRLQSAQHSSPNATTKSSLSGKTVGLGLASVTAATAYLFGSHMDLALPKSLLPALKLKKSQRHGAGFLEGLLLGVGAFVVLDLVVARRVISILSSNKSFTKYPAHKKVPKHIDNNVLLDRGWLDPINYSELPLVKKSTIAPNVLRLTFELPSQDAIAGLPTGQHVSIKATIGGESVSRSYTPVSNNRDKGLLELVIKIYPDGKLTNGYLANLKVGDEVLFRGPKGAMRYHRGMCEKVGMVAGGTGITPMYQLIRAICEDDRDGTEITLIYANRTEQDILLRDELDTFVRRYPKHFKVFYLLDNPPPGWKFGCGHVTKECISKRMPGPNVGSKVLLCGPPGMVKVAKTALVALGFEKPGVSAKMTDQIFVF